jgi:hypothetical protein
MTPDVKNLSQQDYEYLIAGIKASDQRIAELEAQIEGLNGIIESQKQTEDALIKRIRAAMKHMEIVTHDTYHLSVVYNILNGSSIDEKNKP